MNDNGWKADRQDKTNRQLANMSNYFDSNYMLMSYQHTDYGTNYLITSRTVPPFIALRHLSNLTFLKMPFYSILYFVLFFKKMNI